MTAALPSRLLTVASSDYLAGTRVMLDSFLRLNRWFDGPILVVDAGLTEHERGALAADFPHIGFRAPSPELRVAVDGLVNAFPALRSRAARFFSLECLWLDPAGGDVLLCDSDLLFRKDIATALTTDGIILACPDRAWTVGNTRDPATLEERGRDPSALGGSFNAGLIVMRSGAMTSVYRARALALLEPANWAAIRSDHTDQAIFNLLYRDVVTLLPERYNLLVGHAAAIRSNLTGGVTQAAVLHFNGPAKPWALDRHPAAAEADGAIIKALDYWFSAHVAYLTRRHLTGRR